MKHLYRLLGAAALLAGSVTAADFLPLETNNQWVYRAAATGETFEVRVGAPVFVNDHVYFTLHGYTDGPALVRFDDAGQLVAFDEENYREVMVASFTPFERGWWHAHRRACEQEGQTLEKRTVHDGPAGPVRDVLEIRYRSYGCADTGVEGEEFAENIGMLRRTVQTFAGPRMFDLVYARVGRSLIEAMPHGRFTVTVDHSRNSPVLRATLRLQTSLGSGAIALAFPSSQEYEVLLRDGDGNVLWAWSEGQLFTQELHTREVSGEWRTTVEIPKPPSTGEPKAAIYTVQAWMTTMGAAPQFAATVPVTITTGLE
jgi:hypothetical protein